MMYIEGHWETVDSLEDVARLIREYYNEELADKMKELVDDLIEAYNYRIEQLEDQIDSWEANDYGDY